MNTQTVPHGAAFDWALTADGQPVQLFQTQTEAIKAWRKLKTRKNSITSFAVERVQGLFDG